MSDTITCPSCQRTLRVPETLLGQLVKCPTCQQTFTAALDADANGAAEAPPPRKEVTPPRERDRDADEPPRRARRDDEDDYDDRPRRRRRRYQQDHRGTLILVLGIMAFVVPLAGPILGIVAWIMGSNDLKEMRAGRMDPEGESQTNAGRICGMISTILSAVGILGCCAFYGIIIMAGAAGAASGH